MLGLLQKLLDGVWHSRWAGGSGDESSIFICVGVPVTL